MSIVENGFLAELDKRWLREEVIGDKRKHQRDLNGTMVAEVSSDVFVLKDGIQAMAVGVGEGSWNVLNFTGFTLPVAALAAAGIIIRSIGKQINKVGNDLNVLEAILQMDEKTPQNMTAEVLPYIRLLQEPGTADRPAITGVEVKEPSATALRVIQQNFKRKKEPRSLARLAWDGVAFIGAQSGNALRVMYVTAKDVGGLKNTALGAYQDVSKVMHDWKKIRANCHEPTVWEIHRRKLERAYEDAPEGERHVRIQDRFNKEQRARMRLLHHEEAALRDISRARITTTVGLGAVTTILGTTGMLAVFNAFNQDWSSVADNAQSMARDAGRIFTAPAMEDVPKRLADFGNSLLATGGSFKFGALAENAYTIIASLPSFVQFSKELRTLTATDENYLTIVKEESRKYYGNVAQRASIPTPKLG
jgi:hypothetical protein